MGALLITLVESVWVPARDPISHRPDVNRLDPIVPMYVCLFFSICLCMIAYIHLFACMQNVYV